MTPTPGPPLGDLLRLRSLTVGATIDRLLSRRARALRCKTCREMTAVPQEFEWWTCDCGADNGPPVRFNGPRPR